MRGRKPIPTAIKRARGNPGRRPLNHEEPEPRKIAPRCPDFLDADAKREWKRIVKLLLSVRVLTEMDGPALAAYCQLWSRWKYAELHLQKYGAVILSPDKKFTTQSPYLAIANKCMEQMTKILIEFGMTPSSRSRIHLEIDSGPSDLDRFIMNKPQPLIR